MKHNIRLVGLMGILAVVGLISIDTSHADCGTIITESGLDFEIEDCANPFGANPEYPFLVFMGGVILDEGGAYEFPLGEDIGILLSAINDDEIDTVTLWQHVGADLVQVEVNELTPESDYEIYLEDTGTYTLVFNYETEVVTERTLPRWLINTAHAQYEDSEIFARTFTVTAPVVEPACGSYIFPGEAVEPIEDCDAPFGPEQPNADLVVRFGDTVIESDGSYPLATSTDTFTFSGATFGGGSQAALWRHQGDDFVHESFFVEEFTFTTPGTYTLVIEEQELVLSQHWLRKLRGLLLSTAHAALGDRTIITFTVTAIPDEPTCTGTCASSVLFLPGFQASRLYKDGLFGEEQLWEPDFIFDPDTEELAMDETGASVEDVYARDIMTYIGGSTDRPVYGNFIAAMEGLVDEDVIAEFTGLAYDWRYDVFDIVADGIALEDERVYLDSVVAELAADSHTGQVTIVGHSNGGLLAKALISHLEQNDQVALVDQLIMVGTPQLGTPKAIGSLLHGFDQGIRVLNDTVPVVTESTARFVSANMPGAYGLLPGAGYLSVTEEPVVDFISGEATDPLITAYGAVITEQPALDSYLRDSADVRDEVRTLNEALVLNSAVLDQANQTRAALDAWEAPATVEVFSIAGVGRKTVRGFRYEPISEINCSTTSSVCLEKVEYKPIPLISNVGDQTVMTISALGKKDSFVNDYLVDLNKIQDVTDEIYLHYNMTEAPTIQNLVTSIIASTSTSDAFLTQLNDEQTLADVLIGAHSPVYLYIEDMAGRRTGQLDSDTWVTEIPDTEFLSLGGSSYVVAPKTLEFTIHLLGYDNGGVTLTLDDITNDEQTQRHKALVSFITSSTSITVGYESTELQNLLVDLDGDAVVDSEFTPDGVSVEAVTEAVSSGSSRGGRRVIETTPEPQVAGVTMSVPDLTTLSDADLRTVLIMIITRLIAAQNIL